MVFLFGNPRRGSQYGLRSKKRRRHCFQHGTECSRDFPAGACHIQRPHPADFLNLENSILFSGPPIKQELLTLEFPLPAGPVRAIRLEVLPDAKNAGKVGRAENGKFAVTPTFAIVAAGAGPKPLAIAWSQADRRTPLDYDNGHEQALLENEWRSAPNAWESPQNAASLPHHALFHLAQPLASTTGMVLQVTLASENIGKVRLSVTPFGDAIPGQEIALREELAAAASTRRDANRASDARASRRLGSRHYSRC